MNIVLVTSGQPSLNPRLVKEADALAEAGYQVTVIYAYWNAWGTFMDDDLLSKKKWKAIRVGGHPKSNRATYLLSRMLLRLASYLVNNWKIMSLADLALSRASYFLQSEVKKHKADLYIGHNLGALPAVAKAAQKFNKPFGFDAEDMHRYEGSNDPLNKNVSLKTYIEDKYFPQTSYLTSSSPQISNAYQSIFKNKKIITITNACCKHSGFLKKRLANKPIKLFWFSQTIGPNRGLEDVIKAIGLLPKGNVELHLLGQLDEAEKNSYAEKLIAGQDLPVYFYEPLHPDDITAFASQFDIGLALEPAFSINNNLALSNKLFTYIQAGLAVIASNTTAQSDFLSKYPEIGTLYNINDVLSLSQILFTYQNNRSQLLITQKASFDLGQTILNWETERLKFLRLIEKTLKTDH